MPLYEAKNDKEKEVIEEMRKRMKNCMSSDMHEDTLLFYRFLKARDFDIDKAEDMLKKHLVFRKVSQVDTILQDFKPKEAFQYITSSYVGEDKEGNIVIYIPMGSIDVRDVINCFKEYDYYKHWLWMLESKFAHYIEVNKKRQKKISGKCNIIINLENLKLSSVIHPTSAEHLSFMSENFQDNYPEMLQHIFVINAPSFYVLVFSLVKRVIAKEVLRKIHFYGTTGWKEELLKVVDADVLPSFLGGNRTDPNGNPMCKTFINLAGKIPTKYYLSKEDRTFKDRSRVKKIKISPKSSHEIPVEITESNCIIEWEFEVESKDIQFALYFEESEIERKTILPFFKYKTPDGTCESSWRCQSEGKYIIVFDNTYSRFYPKDISYCITIRKSEKQVLENSI